MPDYRKYYDTRRTHQGEVIPGEAMVQNNAGGFAFEVDMWTQLQRFLILGAEDGSYYVSERALVVENAQNVLACIKADGIRTLQTVLEISKAGRAPKNDPALFALAMCSGLGDKATRKMAFEILPQVARIGTHLFHFANFMEGFRGWGRGARRGVANWFLEMEPDKLGYQAIKYKQRDGWSLRDLLRLSHPLAKDPLTDGIFEFITTGKVLGEVPDQVVAAAALSDDSSVAQVVEAIDQHNLPREAIPTKFLNDVEVWDALLQRMPMTAMIRNLGKMTSLGLLAPMSDASRLVGEKLANEKVLQKARVHPINVLAALLIYQQGRGFRGKLSWNPVGGIVDALDGAFYSSFKFVEPTGARTLIGLDVSGSMGGHSVNGMPFMTAREASAAMSMVTARTEANYHMMGFSHKFVPLDISPRQRLDDVIRSVSRLQFGATDCSLPMQWALANKVPVDVFQIYTDNETWYGDIHPIQALRKYRDQMGIPAKMVTCAVTATGFSIGKRPGRGYGRMFGDGEAPAIADPNDGGMLDVAGLDSAAPAVISDFVRG